MQKTILLTLLLTCSAFASAVAQLRTVSSAADSGPGTLREALTTLSATSVRFAATLNGSTITLSSPITISRNVSITGNGMMQTTIKGTAGAFVVTSGYKVKFTSLSINNSIAVAGGAISATDAMVEVFTCSFSDNVATGAAAAQGGGAISAAGGSLRIQDSRFRRNLATGTSGSGGAIIVTDGAALTVTRSGFEENTSSRAGGAIEDASGAATETKFSEVTFNMNRTESNPGNGGAYHITGAGNASIFGGRATDNFASAEGGAFWNGAGRMTIGAVQFMGNSAAGNDANQGGGALYNLSGRVVITGNTTFDLNTALGTSGSGGAILNDVGGVIESYGTTFTNNSASRAGGAIENNGGAGTLMRIANATMKSNRAGSAPGNGGGYHATGAGDVEFHAGLFEDNVAASEGGALWNGSGSMKVFAATIRNNVAQGGTLGEGGGGIYNDGGTVLVTNGTQIIGNRATGAPAGSGGGIFNGMGGSLTVSFSRINSNVAARAGGGIEDASGAGQILKLYSVTMISNRATTSPGNGGALHVTGASDSRISQSNITNNFAAKEGGGLWNGSGRMDIDGTSIMNNTAAGATATDGGGGVYNMGGNVVVTNGSAINGNTASGASGSGGAILNAPGGSIRMYNSFVNSNTANRAGGGIEDVSGAGTSVELYSISFDGNVVNNAPGNGGALHVTGAGDVKVSKGKFNANMAGSEGGALWNGAGVMTVAESSFTDNVGKGNSAENGGGAIYNDSGTLRVRSSSFERNLATGTSGSGGAILNQGIAEVTGSTFMSNTASRAGGAIEDRSNASLTVNDAMFTSNRTGSAPGNGGGIHITGSATVTLMETMFRDNFAASEGGGFWHGTGKGMVKKSRFVGNVAAGDAADNGGGGIFNEGGDLLVDDCYLADNKATGMSGSGGGIFYNVGSSGTVNMSMLERNSASRAGGGIEDNSRIGTLVAVTRSTLQDNSTGAKPGNGGAVHVTGDGSFNITASDVLRNTAANEGGGVWNGSGAMAITQTTIRDNVANGADGGGGVYNQGGDLMVSRTLVASNVITGATAIGAGIHNANPGTVSVTYSTISSNQSAWNAGGIANAGTLEVIGTTIALNTAANRGGGIGQAMGATTATLRSTIVALNTAPTQGANLDVAAGSYVSSGYNLIATDDANVFPAGATDKEGSPSAPVMPGLQPLANNGGPTQTHALTCESDAVEMGDPALTAVDQRGRMVFGVRDIGAYELETACPTTPFNTPQTPVAESANSFSVYPTQTRGNVTIKVGGDYSFSTTSSDDMQVFRLVDATGRLLREIRSSSDQIELNAYDLLPGSYFVQRITESGVESRTFQVLD